MTGWEMVAVAAAGFAAGGINAVVGSGTLVTVPTLLFFGYPPVSANISNSLGLVPGGLPGAWDQRPRTLPSEVRSQSAACSGEDGAPVCRAPT